MPGVVSPHVQDPAFGFVEPHQVPLCPTFQPVQVTLNGSTACWCIYHSSQFGVISSCISMLEKGALSRLG